MNPHEGATALLSLGAVFLASLAVDVIGRRTRLPRVTLLLLLGVCVGPLGFDLVSDSSRAWFPFVTDLALVMVAFLLGGLLTRPMLREHGRSVLVISLVVVVVTAAVVAAGLVFLGWPVAVALPLAAVATSTDPVASSDVVREVGAKGPFTRMLLGIVAFDDAWGIVMMSIVLALLLGADSAEAARNAAVSGFLDLGGAILVGCAVGIPIALLTGRVRVGEPTLAEALGGVLLCGGVALWCEVSFLLAAMTMGMVVANVARHHRRPFRAIEGIEWPFMVLFFVLSGALLDVQELGRAGVLTIAYVLLRIVGRLLGGWLGCWLRGNASDRRGIGLALFPQAGVAIGMALVASERVPDAAGAIITAAVAGTIVFELLGPLLTRMALVRSGEAGL